MSGVRSLIHTQVQQITMQVHHQCCKHVRSNLCVKFNISVAVVCFGVMHSRHKLRQHAMLQIAPVVDASSSQSRADVLVIILSAVLLLTGLQWLALKPKTKPPVSCARLLLSILIKHVIQHQAGAADAMSVDVRCNWRVRTSHTYSLILVAKPNKRLSGRLYWTGFTNLLLYVSAESCNPKGFLH